MDVSDPPDFFAGDLTDPWVAAIAASLPGRPVVLDLPGDWPGEWPEAALQARVVVLHRALLTSHDAERLKALHARVGAPPKVLLCIGPHIRSYELERWGSLIDVVLHEATASETLARHVGADSRPPPSHRPSPRISVVSTSFEARRVLAEGCRWAGFDARPARDWDEVGDDPVVLWDVPVLEESWQDELTREARKRLVVAMLGFADRTTVGQARASGAAACLDVPCDLADLQFVLSRLSRNVVADAPHTVPPRPMGRRAGIAGGRSAARDLK